MRQNSHFTEEETGPETMPAPTTAWRRGITKPRAYPGAQAHAPARPPLPELPQVGRKQRVLAGAKRKPGWERERWGAEHQRGAAGRTSIGGQWGWLAGLKRTANASRSHRPEFPAHRRRGNLGHRGRGWPNGENESWAQRRRTDYTPQRSLRPGRILCCFAYLPGGPSQQCGGGGAWRWSRRACRCHRDKPV